MRLYVVNVDGDELEGCRFVSNNARKDKYVINIAKFL